MNKKSAGMALALAAAVLFSTAGCVSDGPAVSPGAVPASVKCKLASSCNSPSGCHTRLYKTYSTAKECTDQGGTVVD